MARNVSASDIMRDARRAFESVLHSQGPLPLRHVRWWQENATDRVHIDFCFGEDSAQDYHHRLMYEGYDLSYDVAGNFSTVWSSRPGTDPRGDCTPQFERLWSEMCEDHRMREYSRRQTDAARTIHLSGLPEEHVSWFRSEFERTAQEVDRLHGLTRDIAIGIDWGRGDEQVVIERTATEVAIRQQWANEQILRRQAQMEASMRAEFERQCLSTPAPGERTDRALTWDRVRDALQTLNEPDPNAERRRRAEEAARFIQMAQNVNMLGAIDWDRVRGDFVLDRFDGGGGDVGTPEAQQRGMTLLRENLTPEQRKSFDKHKHFIVIGGTSGRKYRIREGRQINIDVLKDDGTRDHKLCFLPQGQLVTGDVMLAQKVALECMEEDALKVANRWGD